MNFDRELDVKGLNCPLPILRTKKALSEMSSGQILRVLATDPGAVKDFHAFSKQTGNQFGDLGNPVPGKIGAADQTAHAVTDQNNLLGAGSFANLIDSPRQLWDELADTGVGRNEADTGHCVACCFKIAADFPPDTP